VFPGSSTPTSFSATKIGTMALAPGDTASRTMSQCAGGLTHVTNTLRTSINARWTAPAAGRGAVTVYAMVVPCRTCTNYQATLTVPEQVAASVSSTASVSAAAAAGASQMASPSAGNSPTGTATTTASGSVAPSGSSAASASLSGTHTPTGSGTGSASGAPPSMSTTATASLSNGASASATASVAGSQSGTASVAASASALSTPSRSMSHTRSASSSVTATASASLSAAATPTSSLPAASPTASVSPSVAASPASATSTAPSPLPGGGATPSPALSAGAVPAAAASAYPSATRISTSLTLRWRLDNATASVAYRLESTSDAGSPGPVWLSLSRATCKGMFTRGAADPRACSAPAVTGIQADGSTAQLLVPSEDMGAMVPVDAGQSTLRDSSIFYDPGSGTSTLAFTRPLAASGHASELPVNPRQNDGYVYAVGSSPDFGMHDSCGYFELRLSPPTCSRTGTCSGHGSCDAEGVACVCDVGYTGSSCNRCAVGFSNAGASGSWCTVAPLQAAGSVGVKVTLRLLLNFTDAGAAGSPARAAFVAALKGDIAKALDVNAARLNVTALRPGSILVDLVILPPTLDPAQMATASSSLSAPALAQRLASLVESPFSALYGSSAAVTSALDPGTAPVFESYSAAPSRYTFAVPLGGGLTLSWRLQEASIAQQLAYDGRNGPVWISAGINSSPSMVGGDVIAFEPGKPPGAQVNQWMMVSKINSGVNSLPPEALQLSAVAVTPGTGGAVTVEWTRPLAAGSYEGALPMSIGGQVTVLWAIGAAGQMTMGRHTRLDAGSVTVDLSTGAFSATLAPNKQLQMAHGVIQFLAWGLCAPVGAVVARYGRDMPFAPTGARPFWVTAHVALQSCAAILSALGSIIAVAMVLPGTHFRSAHQVIGILLSVSALGQAVMGVLRPFRKSANEMPSRRRRVWELVHRVCGFVLVVAGVVSVFLGLARYGAASAVSAAYGTFAVCLVGYVAWREAWSRWWRPSAPVDVHNSGGVAKGSVPPHLASANIKIGADGRAQRATGAKRKPAPVVHLISTDIPGLGLEAQSLDEPTDNPLSFARRFTAASTVAGSAPHRVITAPLVTLSGQGRASADEAGGVAQNPTFRASLAPMAVANPLAAGASSASQ